MQSSKKAAGKNETVYTRYCRDSHGAVIGKIDVYQDEPDTIFVRATDLTRKTAEHVTVEEAVEWLNTQS